MKLNIVLCSFQLSELKVFYGPYCFYNIVYIDFRAVRGLCENTICLVFDRASFTLSIHPFY